MNFVILCAAVLCASAFTGNVQAYLDPGTGSMAIQIVLAGIVGALAATKAYWQRLTSLFGTSDRHRKSPLD